jgi:ankyrin repeat protein
VVLTQDILHITDQFKDEKEWQKVLGDYTRNAKALIPENIFAGNPDTIDKGLLQSQESSAMDFLKLITYLISNNFSRETEVISKHIYKGVKSHLNTGLLKYLFSIDGDTTEKLASNLFSLAIEASDIDVAKKMMEWGINPNTRANSPFNGAGFTPLQHACWVQSVEVVQALIDGGAGLSINIPARGNDILSLVIHPDLAYKPYPDNRPQDSTEDGRYHKEQVKIKLIQILLRAGATVNPGHGRSPLAIAARFGHAEIVTLLIAAGSDVNFSSAEFRSTPLRYAVMYDEGIPERDLLTIVRSLLRAGADVQERFPGTYRSKTVLEEAIPRKSSLVVQLLLTSGARITEYAFAMAAEYCNTNTVDLFIKSGARVTEGIIRCAAKNEECGPFWLLLDAAEDSIKHKCKCAALGQCISEGNLDLIEQLVKSGAEPKFDSRPDEGIEAIVKRGDMHILSLLLDRYQEEVRTSLGLALTAAILSNRNDATEMLLTAGANVDGEQDLDEVEFDPLSAAISQKNSRLIQRLLAAGAAVNRTRVIAGFKGNPFEVVVTVLPTVVSWGDHFLIQDIISAGANVNAPGYPEGETALAAAIWRGDTRIVDLLIDAGADVNANAALLYGPTALEVASGNNDLRMVQFLLGLGADPDEWSLTQAISGSVELVKTLLAARLDRYRRYSNGYGCRALQYAIKMKSSYMVNILLAKGIDANAIIQRGFGDGVESNSLCRRPDIVFGVSALGYAIQEDNSDNLWIVQALLNSGAGPNSIVTNSFDPFENFETRTALLEAINRNNLAMVKKLIMEGADVNPGARGDIFITPLQAAAKKGSIDIVYLLLEHGADVNAPPHYRHGATALQFAAIGGYTGIALLLLEKGAHVNALPAQIDGRTALEGAAEHGRKDMVRILLIARARIIGIGGEQYERALKFASKNGQDSTCRLLEKYKEQSWESLVDWDAK